MAGSSIPAGTRGSLNAQHQAQNNGSTQYRAWNRQCMQHGCPMTCRWSPDNTELSRLISPIVSGASPCILGWQGLGLGYIAVGYTCVLCACASSDVNLAPASNHMKRVQHPSCCPQATCEVASDPAAAVGSEPGWRSLHSV